VKPSVEIDIVTFNDNEAAAVDRLFDDLVQPVSVWARDGRDAIRFGALRDTRIRHVSLRAQGNVIAGARLAETFADQDSAKDLVIFYGCAGCLNPDQIGQAYLVSTVSYLSLGTVEAGKAMGAAMERVTLKNKWLCDIRPREVDPLPSITFEEALLNGTLNLPATTSLTQAHVIATDKVIRVNPSSSAPQPLPGGIPRREYKKAEWSYADAMAYARDNCGNAHVLVEMESYGIGSIAEALQFKDRVVMIRIATDDLIGHAHSDPQQRDLLMDGRLALARILYPIVMPPSL
jgi:hypothetical protein